MGNIEPCLLCATLAIHCAVHGLVFLPICRKLLQVSPFFSGVVLPRK